MPNASDIVQEDDVEYVYQFIKGICTEIGPGCPGSPQEKKRAMKVKKAMEQIADTIEEEEFTIHPGAFIGWFRIGASLAVVAMIFFYLSLTDLNPRLFALLAFGICLFIFLMLIYEFILSVEFIDFIFPKAKSENIVGSIKPKNSQEIKKVIIFSGHHDSALQFNWLKYLKQGYYVAEGILIGGVIFIMIGLTIYLYYVLSGIEAMWIITFLKWLSYIVLPAAFIIGFFFAEFGKNGGKVPGAIDNLTAVGLSLAMGKIIKRHPELIPSNTEIRLISFGAEEAGVRGAAAYVKKHLNELKSHDTVCINIETIVDPTITIYTSDRNNTIRNSMEVVNDLDNAAKNANVPHNVKPFIFGGGGTDVAPFSKAKIKGTCLFSLLIPKQMIEFYHQPSDNYDKINKDALRNALLILTQYLYQKSTNK